MANFKFSELPAGAALTGAEIIADSQSGVSVQHTIQDIAEFVGDTSFNYGDGIAYNPGTNTLSADINVTNLQFTANQINTIQDIATTASPIFNALTLNGTLTAFQGYQSYAQNIGIVSSQLLDNTLIGKVVTSNAVTDVTITIPLGLVTPGAASEFEMLRVDTGGFALQADPGVFLNGVSGGIYSLPDRYDRAVVRKLADDNWSIIEYSGAVGAINQQDVYDNSGDGLIALDAGKPWGLTSTVAGFLAPSMSQAQFDAIASPDNGLLAWANSANRFRVNTGSPGAPTYENLAYFTDIPQDDTSYGQISFKNNAAATVIAAPATYVKVNGTYVFGLNLNFTEAAGVLTYTGVETKVFDLGCSLSASLNLSTESITGAVFKNGAEVVDSSQSVYLGPESPADHSLSINTLVSLSNGDTIEFRVQNDTATDDITVSDFSLCCSTVGGAIGNADDQVVISWDGLSTPTTVTSGFGIDITAGVISFTGGSQFLQVASNLSDVADKEISGRNIGITDDFETINDELDRTYTTSTQPASITANYTTSGHFIQLCPMNQSDSPRLGSDLCMIYNGGTESVEIRDGSGTPAISLLPSQAVETRARNNTSAGGNLFLNPKTFTVNGQSGFASITGGNVTSLYTPTNYTPTSASIDGNLQGIDNALAGGGGGSLQAAYNVGNVIDQSGGPRFQVEATDDPFIDIISNADGQTVRSGLSFWSENTATTLINGGNIRNWLPGNAPGSEYSIMEFQVYDELLSTQFTAMQLSGHRTSLPGLILNGNYPLQAGGKGGFGISVGFPNEIDASCQFDVKSPGNNLISKPYPAMTQAQIDAVPGPIKGGMAYNTDSNRLRVNIGSSGAPDRREVAYTTDLPVGRLAEVLATTQVPVTSYPFDVWTSMMGTLNGSNIIAANTLTTGQTVEVDITGIWVTTVNGNNSNIRVSFAGVVLATSSNLAVTGFTGAREWMLKLKITVTGGATITASATGWYSDASNNMRPMGLIITPVSLPYNSTIANTIDVEYNPSSIGGTTDFIANNLNIIQYK